MVILGIGSNLGDRLANLRGALTRIKNIPNLSVQQISPVYISDALVPENAPNSWNMPYLNLALRAETKMTPYEVLNAIKSIERLMGRKPEKDWGPRLIDIDMLAWDDLIQYDEKLHIPHEHLAERPFALWPLTDVAPRWIHPQFKKTAAEMVLPWGSRFSGEAPLHTKQIQQRIDTPILIGILNITPDSFSDGGKFIGVNAAVQHIRHLVAEGAEVIDIGAEATGPNAISLDADTEWQRLEPILNGIMSELTGMHITPKISIDTRHAQVAKKALELKVDWINDVSGLIDPEMREIVATSHCDVVIMHHLSIPVKKNQLLPLGENPIKLVYQWAEEKIALLEKNGITSERIIFDPGIGYGKTAEQSLEIIKNIKSFSKLKTRLLIGHSRKSFLQQFTQKPPNERDVETVALSTYLANARVDYLRVHNVETHARAFKAFAAIDFNTSETV